MSWVGSVSSEEFLRRKIDIISNALGVPLFGLSDQEKHDHVLRLAWSLAGRRMLASLFDETESGEGTRVSVQHTKRAFSETYSACLEMFLSETDDAQAAKDSCTDIADKAFSAYLNAGFFRKSPNWVKSAPPSCSCEDPLAASPANGDVPRMFLLRGIGPGLSVGMSGLGPWMIARRWNEIQTSLSVNIPAKPPVDFLNLHSERIEDGWSRLLHEAQWERIRSDDLVSHRIFCFTNPGFGLWKNFNEVKSISDFSHSEISKNSVTLAITRHNDKPKTFLFRENENGFELSPISEADALRRNEWLLAASCDTGAAPFCTVKSLGAAVSTYEWSRGRRHEFTRIHLSMRPSMELEAFLKVYSWPAKINSPDPWNRIMPKGIFNYFQPLLIREGFRIVQQNVNQQ